MIDRILDLSKLGQILLTNIVSENRHDLYGLKSKIPSLLLRITTYIGFFSESQTYQAKPPV